MPYVLSTVITSDTPGLWGEGNAYSSSVIYDIDDNDPAKPPVHYCEHHLKPHSVAHLDFASHIVPRGRTCESYFEFDRAAFSSHGYFWGRVIVLRLKGGNWSRIEGNDRLSVWKITQTELMNGLAEAGFPVCPPEKLFLTPDVVRSSPFHSHDPDCVFVLSLDAAKWLSANERFNAFGTSWKSCDFEPGSRERPVHKQLLRQAVLYEYLDLANVPTGEYFLAAAPIRLNGASESPVTPLLFTYEELTR